MVDSANTGGEVDKRNGMVVDWSDLTVLKLQFLESLDPTLRSFVEIRTPATAKMAAETVNLAFETKAVDFSKKGKFDNQFKNNGNLNWNRPMENGASGSDGKAAQNDSQVLKCYLCDENHKRINCPQHKTEHCKKN